MLLSVVSEKWCGTDWQEDIETQVRGDCPDKTACSELLPLQRSFVSLPLLPTENHLVRWTRQIACPLARQRVECARQVRITVFSYVLRWIELRRSQRQHTRPSLWASNARLFHSFQGWGKIRKEVWCFQLRSINYSPLLTSDEFF